MKHTNLSIQKRLAASVLKCGKRRVFLDPARASEIEQAASRQAIRRLHNRGYVVKKAVTGQSRFRCRMRHEAKRKGRHMGLGKRKGSANARQNFKRVWICKIRVMRRILRKYRARNVIDKHSYRKFYGKAKGNQFRNKKVLIEAIWDAKNQQTKNKLLTEQREARYAKSMARMAKAQAKAQSAIVAA